MNPTTQSWGATISAPPSAIRQSRSSRSGSAEPPPSRTGASRITRPPIAAPATHAQPSRAKPQPVPARATCDSVSDTAKPAIGIAV